MTLLARLALVALSLASAPAAAADPALDWARAFYGGGPFCGTARVTAVGRDGDDIAVTLEIDPRWSESLAGLAPARRGRWFALHCPYVTDAIWAMPGAGDVVVTGRAEFLGPFRFACRRHVFAP
ncbi:MAG: hypothetical protein H6907_12585 [Hyphomicrobiales bacterium]|nr:hypothetical protein [Hyphomicrobiales bacterium]MCP5372559.1 hypothetical protein [Hyphomicrobiales bacterium]